MGNNPLFYLDPTGFCGVGSSGDDDANDFWQDISEFVFGEPASASPFPGDESYEVAVAPAIPIGIGAAVATTAAAAVLLKQQQDRMLGKDKKDETSLEEFERQIWWDEQKQRLQDGFERTREYLEDTVERIIDDIDLRDDFQELQRNSDALQDRIDKFLKGDPDEFDPNNINRDQQIVEPGIEVETFPGSNDGSLDGQTGEFPDNTNTDIKDNVEEFPTGVNEDLESPVFDSRNDSQPLTNSQAKDLASELGFKKVRDFPFNSHGKTVFTNGKQYITPDRDGHNGGVWKLFDRKGNRVGTYNRDLSERINK